MGISSLTVKEVLDRIDSQEILLPSMQRKFVWSEEKIINLFDSILRGYPFGGFIFWHIDNKKEINNYHFYQFIKNYSERDLIINNNQMAGKIGRSSIDVVMDGQQRLTSLYIGLKGSLTSIGKGKKKQKAENWKKKHLYIKPFISPDEKNEDETPFRFLFLEDSFVQEWNANREDFDKYYLVSDFYGMTKVEFYEQLGVKRIRAKHDDWRVILESLRSTINDERIINIHTIKNKDIYNALEIFKRINNGGTPLSTSNLLFSTVITSWDKGREEMDDFVSSINQEGVLVLQEYTLVRICLYLMNKPSAAKMDMLTKDVVDSIKNNWDSIKKAIIDTKNFLKKHNIFNAAIISYNALLPIVYYYYYQKPNCSTEEKKTSEQQLFYYFAISQLFSLFGGHSASVLDAVRKSMCIDYENDPGNIITPFEVKNLYEIDLSAERIHAFKIGKEQIEKLVDSVHYGDKKAFSLLSFLQPDIVLKSGEYDIDHVCSKDELHTVFKKKRKEERKELENKKNLVSNLQLLDYQQNRTDKNAAPLYTWVVEKRNKISFDPYENDNDNEKYKITSIEVFLEFYNKRRGKIVDYLCDCLGVTNNSDKKKNE